jgi:lipopolysaccharide/colanic/teichoic acid biosynthesis glycosyltransferase
MTNTFYSRSGKRYFDAFVAFAGLVLLAPAFALLGLCVYLDSGSPIFFRQERTGRDGKPFRIWKFRTMKQAPEAHGALVTAAGDSRVTRAGLWLRRTKCDELPQLINVLLGEMSLVGPRPEVPYYTAGYTSRQRDVLRVRPGVTGPTANLYISEEELLAKQPDQATYYRAVLLPAKLEMDLDYAKSIGFNKDLKLLANTISGLLLKSRHVEPLTASATQKET